MSDLDVRFELNPAAIFQNCPEDPGVYTIESTDGDVLWIDFSRNLTQGVTKHLPENELRNEVIRSKGRFFRFFLTDDESYLAQIFDAYVQRKGRFPEGMRKAPPGSAWVDKPAPGRPATSAPVRPPAPSSSVPGRPRSEAPVAPPRAESSSQATGPLTILLVDDDVQLLVLMKELLEIEGHTVYAATNKRMLSQAIKVDPIHVMILDFHLQDLTAEHVVAEVRARQPEALVLLIADTEHKEAAYALLSKGVKKIFPKPFSMKMLLRAVLEHFGLERAAASG